MSQWPSAKAKRALAALFVSDGGSNGNRALTEPSPDKDGQIFSLPLTTAERLARECLPAWPSTQVCHRKISRRLPRIQAADQPRQADRPQAYFGVAEVLIPLCDLDICFIEPPDT